MNALVTGLLRLVLGFMFLGVLLVQTWVLPDISGSLAGQYAEAAHLRTPALVVSIVILAMAQVVLVCLWRLVALVRRDAVFSRVAFRWVDVIIGAAVAAAALAFGLLIWLTRQTVETGIQPGVALMLVGCSVLAVGIALVVGVLRSLLVSAVGLKGEATTLRAELDEVI